MSPNESDLRRRAEEVFTILESAAINGRRCPLNEEISGGRPLQILTRSRRIRILISGQNWRQVEILAGPHAGAKTLAEPRGLAAHWIVDETGKRRIDRPRNSESPRAATYAREPRLWNRAAIIADVSGAERGSAVWERVQFVALRHLKEVAEWREATAPLQAPPKQETNRKPAAATREHEPESRDPIEIGAAQPSARALHYDRIGRTPTGAPTKRIVFG